MSNPFSSDRDPFSTKKNSNSGSFATVRQSLWLQLQKAPCLYHSGPASSAAWILMWASDPKAKKHKASLAQLRSLSPDVLRDVLVAAERTAASPRVLASESGESAARDVVCMLQGLIERAPVTTLAGDAPRAAPMTSRGVAPLRPLLPHEVPLLEAQRQRFRDSGMTEESIASFEAAIAAREGSPYMVPLDVDE